MTRFEPEVIERFAQHMYARSGAAVVAAGVIGAMLGMVLDPFVQSSLPPFLNGHWPEWASPLLFGILGVMHGLERASLLKLQAQTALCQLAIERNTRAQRETSTP